MAGFDFGRLPDAAKARLRSVQAEIAALRFQRAALGLEFMLKHNFNPDQPRVSAGQPGGGRWSGEGFVRVAASEEENKPEEEFDPASELRESAFLGKVNAIRRLEPNNPNLTYVTAPGVAPGWNIVDAYERELQAAQTRVSEKIASGHAFEAHASEFGVSSRTAFAAIIRQTIRSPFSQVRGLTGGRTMYYDTASNTVVFVQPASRDGGSMFRPEEGQVYINRQK